jgi:hypothetical protein
MSMNFSFFRPIRTSFRAQAASCPVGTLHSGRSVQVTTHPSSCLVTATDLHDLVPDYVLCLIAVLLEKNNNFNNKNGKQNIKSKNDF